MKIVPDIDNLNDVVKKYFVRKTQTNSYLLLDEYQQHISCQRLFYTVTESNLFLLIRKNGFYRLYYYINSTDEPLKIDTCMPVVMEIIYRGVVNKPEGMIAYWERCGFSQHLIRDNLTTTFKQIHTESSQITGLELKYATTDEECIYTRGLLKDTLDKYTGDILSLEEVRLFAEKKNILCAYSGGELCGILQFEIKSNVVWLGHIAIDAGYRGKGIAKELVKAYINDNVMGPNTRYQLWVIQNNIGAVSLYRKFGFVYANRSTLSMLKPLSS